MSVVTGDVRLQIAADTDIVAARSEGRALAARLGFSRTDATLIATASDAGHTSFGCADDRDLTYFGEAFLKESVPTTASLEAAFKKAADLIQHRESAEHLDHSNPQLYVGPAIRQRLMLLENGAGHKHEDAVVVRR